MNMNFYCRPSEKASNISKQYVFQFIYFELQVDTYMKITSIIYPIVYLLYIPSIRLY